MRRFATQARGPGRCWPDPAAEGLRRDADCGVLEAKVGRSPDSARSIVEHPWESGHNLATLAVAPLAHGP